MKEFWKNLKFAWKYCRGQKANLIKYLILNIISVIISVLFPLFSAKQLLSLTDNALFQLVFISLIMVLIGMLGSLIGYFSRGYSQKIFRSCFTEVQTDVGKKILKLKNSTVDDHGTGVFIQRLTVDSTKLSEIFNIVTFWGTNIIKDIGVYVAIFILSKEVFVFILFFVILIYFLENRKASLKSSKDKEYREKKEKTTSFVGEIVRGLRDIKMLNSESSFIDELHNKIVTMNESHFAIIDIIAK